MPRIRDAPARAAVQRIFPVRATNAESSKVHYKPDWPQASWWGTVYVVGSDIGGVLNVSCMYIWKAVLGKPARDAAAQSGYRFSGPQALNMYDTDLLISTNTNYWVDDVLHI